MALLQYFILDHQSKLDLAVRYDDLPLAECALKEGAEPHSKFFQSSNPAMRSLLLQAQRKSILYARLAVRKQDTELDRALRNGDYRKAHTLLIKMTDGKGLRADWRAAVKQGQLDILRALLVLGYVDDDPGFRMEQGVDDKIEDAAILQVMKAVPYYSPKRDPMVTFNGKVKTTFKNKKAIIWCRHLVEHRQKKQASHPAIKSTYEEFAKKKIMAAKIKVPEEVISRVKARATEVHLIDNRHFGSFVAGQFRAMKESDTNSRQILMESTNHAMSVELRIKQSEDGQTVYVMKFYDPNRTITHIRSATRDPAAFAALDFNRFVDANWLAKYYPEPAPVSMMYARPSKVVLETNVDLPAVVVADRKLSSVLNEKEINGLVIWHLLDKGFAGNLRALNNEIASRPEKERAPLLGAKHHKAKTSGLFMALENGHADAIDKYIAMCEVAVQDLSIADRKRLLKAIRASYSIRWPILNARENLDFYKKFKKENQALYARFKALKAELKRELA